ncbi:hypothetical protein QCD70_03455 [Agreia sp. PsM10]|uniref:glycosyltransferase family protein n=1 Tax=Agreia sp. PsM10 TaxID=3030533 RepID=UPI00263B7E02|nr:glycosyltransferase [Agreia sp. PsM10]MDN4639293.1 hypothetical protein [Agreia sp. PsM10]
MPGAVNILWVISHPELVDRAELGDDFDVRFAASVSWARSRFGETGVEVLPLLQATNPERFFPGPPDPDLASDVLFVGTSRNVFRPIVKDALSAGAAIDIYGPNWTQFIDAVHIRADSLDNARTPAAYRSARVVLNDHWADMRREGFLSNRLFDAVGAGAVVVSDDIAGLAETFGRSVVPYSSVPHLRNLLSPDYPWPSEEDRRRTAASIHAHHSFEVRGRQLTESIRRAMRLRLRATLRELLPKIRSRSPRSDQ